jgi:transposase
MTRAVAALTLIRTCPRRPDVLAQVDLDFPPGGVIRLGVLMKILSVVGRKPFLSNKTLKYLYLDEQLTAAEIGEMYGYSRSSVCRFLREADISVRPTPRDKFDLRADDLRRMYLDEGLSTKEIGAKKGCSWTTRRRLLEASVPLHTHRGPPLKNPPVEDLKRMYLVEKLTAREIAEELGYSPATVNVRLHQAGIKLRSGAESSRSRSRT